MLKDVYDIFYLIFSFVSNERTDSRLQLASPHKIWELKYRPMINIIYYGVRLM